MQSPCGCDTFVAFPPTSPAGTVTFGKNSDRPAGEGQSIRKYPSRNIVPGNHRMVQCTYIQIPESNDQQRTYSVILSQIDWMFGAEMGANECGVVIGNEAVWTKEPDDETPALLGMDLLRIGLERGANAHEALNVITDLLEKHGQGGACAENDPTFTYHNSFLIVDSTEAWVLETAGRHWAAERIVTGYRNISNGLTIRNKIDKSSNGLEDYAKNAGYWDRMGEFDFAKSFSAGSVEYPPSSRQVCGSNLLKKHENKGTLNEIAMMQILRDHESGICMHGGFETSASMVSVLRQDGSKASHWFTGKSYPCKSEFIIQEF
jgi:secernin